MEKKPKSSLHFEAIKKTGATLLSLSPSPFHFILSLQILNIFLLFSFLYQTEYFNAMRGKWQSAFLSALVFF